MKIVKIVGNAFINTVPAVEGDYVKPYDMLDTREATVTFEDGTEFVGMCTRLVDLGLADIDAVIAEVTEQEPLTPVIEPVQPASEVTEETAEVAKK